PTPTTLRSAADVFPAGTAFIGLDRNTGAVDALDGNGGSLRTLFNAGVETTHHWPTISQLQLAPDRRTLWYADNPTALAPCSSITERDLVAGASHVRFQGSWIALSPDGTRLAYTGCFGRDSTVHIVDLGSNRAWTAGSPGGRTQAAVGYVAWTADSRSVLVEYLDDAARWHVSTLTPTSRPGTIEWGPTVFLLSQQDRLTATPAALYVAAGNAAGNAWSIDAYDWSFRRISHVLTQLGPLEIAVRDGRTYVIGGPFTGGSGYDTALYRLEPNGQLAEIRHGIGEIVAVPSTASTPTTTIPTTTTSSTSAPPPSTARCTPGQIQFALDRDLGSTMQQPAAFFSLKNTSSSKCTLNGYPNFEVLDASGNRIPLTLSDGNTYQINDPVPHEVVVDPGGVVYFGFGWLASNPPNGNHVGCVQSASARARLPGSDVPLRAPAQLATPICATGGSVTAIAERGAFTIATP
ncbi:MAG: hypothetical protein QOI08_2320, partial [Actinomycetota bacterium]|nr:hypothetical protein [Actinomycetota bacterium]